MLADIFVCQMENVLKNATLISLRYKYFKIFEYKTGYKSLGNGLLNGIVKGQ